MNDDLNPYAATQSELIAGCEPIPFAGEITREDLPALLPTFLLRRLLFVLSLLIVLPFAAVPAASVAVGIHTGSEVLGMALWVLFLVVFISIALWLS